MALIVTGAAETLPPTSAQRALPGSYMHQAGCGGKLAGIAGLHGVQRVPERRRQGRSVRLQRLSDDGHLTGAGGKQTPGKVIDLADIDRHQGETGVETVAARSSESRTIRRRRGSAQRR